MNYKIAQFILTPGQRAQSTLEIYLAQPDANKEALAGKLFALIEIESTKAENLKIINFLINTLNHNYYQNEKMILRERVNSIKIEHIFESALAKTNKKLAEFLQSEKIKLNPEILNITIGVIYNDSLHFANLGKNKALLIYQSKTDDQYKMADITEKTQAGETKKSANPTKLFSNVVSGALPRGGYFVFAGETFAEYLSAKQITHIITTLPPAGAAEQIKNTLGKINAYVPFVGLIIKNTAGLEMPEIKIKEPPASTKSSIDNLITTEEKTEKLLTTSGLINLKKWPSFFGRLTGRFKPAIKTGAPVFSLKDKIFTKRKPGWLSFKKIFNFIKNIFIYLAGLVIYIYKITTDKKALTEFFNGTSLKTKNVLVSAKAAAVNSYFWYKNLTKTNKILLAAFLACLIILTANLGWQNLKNKKAENLAAMANLISAIELKENQIDASLLYNNEAGAKKILAEVKDLLIQLPQKSQEQKEQANALAAKYQVQMEKISRVTRSSPVELADFINLNAGAKPTNITLANGKIFAADAAQKTIYSLDLKTKLATAVKLNEQNLNRLDFPSLDKNNNIYYLDNNKLIVLDVKTEKLSSLAIAYGNLEKIIDLKQYNNRFYLVDAATGQISRLSKSADKLSGATPWLNSQEDLTGVASLAIDGNIYLLHHNGEVAKYTKGKKQDFAMAAVEPTISRAAKIIISEAQDFLYIFEPAAKRVVVYDKAGKFIAQYLNDKLADLKDFQIDEANKKIYLLDKTSVYSIDLNHLK